MQRRLRPLKITLRTETVGTNMVSFKDVFGRSPKVLWIASSGGHVAEAHRIEQIIGANPESKWVTFDVPQTRSLLADRRVEYVDYVAPRDFKGAVKAAKKINEIHRLEQFDYVISTGSAIAFFSLPSVALRGRTPTYYVESLARSTGPSLTGRLMRLAPRVNTYTQHSSWASKKWAYTGTILDRYEAASTTGDVPPALRIFVTLGTIRPYRFDRLVDAVKRVLRPEDEVIWQLGVTSRSELPGVVHESLTGSEMDRLIADSDVVITHSGVGSILASLEHGKVPVVAVREGKHGEHVDDHQKYIAEVTVSRGVALQMDLSAPTRSTLVQSASRRVVGADV